MELDEARRAVLAEGIAAKVRLEILDLLSRLTNEQVVGFYEEQWPVYADRWTHELESPVTATELNKMVELLKSAYSLLEEVRTYLDQRADVKDSEDGPKPDSAMQMLARVNEVMLAIQPKP